jgi:hypothetical protein
VPTTLTDRQTILDFITGLAFLGTGGGAGRIEDALEMLEPVLVDPVGRSAASRHRLRTARAPAASHRCTSPCRPTGAP